VYHPTKARLRPGQGPFHLPILQRSAEITEPPAKHCSPEATKEGNRNLGQVVNTNNKPDVLSKYPGTTASQVLTPPFCCSRKTESPLQTARSKISALSFH